MRCLQIFSSQVPIVMCGKSPLSPPARGRGFTLVELLVVAGIIAVLVALLLPAINSVREAGRRTACTANLNRLALAMTQFDTQHGGLPGWRNRLPLVGGVQTRWGANSRQASWAVMLLPLLERNDVYAEMAANRLWGDQSPKQGLLMPEFLCPSFKPKTQRYDYSVLHYGVNVGSGVDPDDGVLVDNLGAHRMSLEDVNAGDGTAFTMLHSRRVAGRLGTGLARGCRGSMAPQVAAEQLAVSQQQTAPLRLQRRPGHEGTQRVGEKSFAAQIEASRRRGDGLLRRPHEVRQGEPRSPHLRPSGNLGDLLEQFHAEIRAVQFAERPELAAGIGGAEPRRGALPAEGFGLLSMGIAGVWSSGNACFARARQDRCGRGFTLVELLAVVAIIAVLAGLLLPAIQAARESARLGQCRNSLRQMATACQSHENALDFFPVASGGYGGTGDPDLGAGLVPVVTPDYTKGSLQRGGWQYNILPYMDQVPLHQLGAREAILAASNAYQAAMDAGDGPALAAMWTPDGDIVDAFGNVSNGREAVRGMLPESQRAGGLEFVLHETSLRFLTDEVALEDGTVEIRVPGAAVPLSGRFTAAWIKTADGWRISALREAKLEGPGGAETLADLDWMVGEWSVKNNAASPKSAQPLIEVSGRWNSTKTFLIRDVRVSREGRVVLHVTQRIGWDPLHRELRGWIFSSDGSHGEAVWSRDGDTWLAKTTAVSPDGSQHSALNVYTYDGKGTCHWRSFPTHAGGEGLPPVDMTLTRKQADEPDARPTGSTP